MTDTNEAVIAEALSVIDKALAQMLRRELVSSGEVTDVLLDVRTLLTLPATTPPSSSPRLQAASRSANAFSRHSRSNSGSVTAAVSMLTPMSRLWL